MIEQVFHATQRIRNHLMEDNEGAKAIAENPLSSDRNKHIDVRWHFIRKLVEKKELKVVHVESE